MAGPLTVGAFEISRVLGTGGMGDVWLGRHVGENYPVAIKILRPRSSSDDRYLTYFRNEVRSVAGLSHPNIIDVYDYGNIEAATADASEGKLRAGSPWLAMELANHGSLLDWRGRLDWSLLRGIMVALLDALAHAHARGVLHRDLKGANVLVAGASRTVKLADFGLADPAFGGSAVDAPTNTGVAGTPWYMAPEQFAGARQEQGPWTDLYAFGCLAWALLTGAPPFPEKGWAAARMAHLTRAPPELKPRIHAPDRVGDWLHTLLEKRAQDRFRTAADAAWALLQLGDPLPGAAPLPALVGDAIDLPAASSTHAFTFTDNHEFAEAISTQPAFPRPAATVQWPLPPFPEDWRLTEAARTKAPMSVGLGLYGLRSISIVDREQERDLLWRELQRVRSRQRPAVIILQGQAGAGKSCLAKWLFERGQELGAAISLRATHGALPGVQDGMGQALSRYFRCGGLKGKVAREHIESELNGLGIDDEHEIAGIAALIRPPGVGEEGMRFESPTERWSVSEHFLERLCAERPIIYWIDDAHRSLDSIAYTRFLLDLPPTTPRPILVVLTVREEDLVDYPLGSTALTELAAHPGVTHLTIDPLEQKYRRELVRRLLGLEASLAKRIEERTGGNPLFAVQLVGDLVDRGVLAPGKRGFKLARGAKLNLPSDLHQVWLEKVERVLTTRSPEERSALQIAAVLGQEIDPLEWHAVCTRLGVPVPDDLLETLLSQRLATANEAGPEWGWTFVHGMLRESIEQSARQADESRWREYHLACAQLMEEQNDPTMALRFGRHLLAAGQLEQALDPLLEAASSADLDARVAEGLLIEREQAADDLDLTPSDRRRSLGWLRRAEVLIAQGREQEAARWASRSLDAAETNGWEDLTAGAFHLLAEIARLKHRFGQSLQLRRRAVFHAIKGGDARRQANSMAGIGRLYLDVGNWPQAARAYQDALQIAKGSSFHATAADCLTSLGYIAVKTGRVSESDDYFLEAGDYVHRSGSRVQQAHLLNALADLARKRGDFAVAEEHSRDALRFYLATGTRAAQVMMLNLSLFQVLQAKYEDAHATVSSAMGEELTSDEGKAFTAGCLAILLPCLAHAGEWDDWFPHLDTIGRTFSGDMFVDDDTLAMLELAAKLAYLAGERKRAEAAYKLAKRLWVAVGREEEAERIDEQMRASR